MNRTTLLALAALIFISFTPTSSAFFEEPVRFGGKEVSTVHFYLARAISRCAGFSEIESETIAAWSQLMDSGELDDPILGHLEQHFGTRQSPHFRLFHWARPRDLETIKLWVMGLAPLTECVDAECTSKELVITTVQPKTPEAFGVYLHALADHYSHEDCLAQGQQMHSSTVNECELDNHFLEFGPEAAEHTFVGIGAMVKETVWWASMNRTLTSIVPNVMEGTVNRFVTRSSFWHPENRVQIADDLLARCAVQPEWKEIRF